jgi:hypothetical protein
MKKIFTLFASLVLTFSLFAADRPKSTLSIKSQDQGFIRVIIDGRRFEPSDNELRVSDIRPGTHSVKVYRTKSMGFFTIFGQRYEMVFSGAVNVSPRSNVMISIDRFGRSSVMDARSRGWDREDRNWNQGNDFGYDRGAQDGDYNDRDRNDRNTQGHGDGSWNGRDSHDGNNGGYGNGNSGYGTGNGGYGNGNSGYGTGNGGYGNGNSGYGSGAYAGKVMSDNEFGRMLENISRERFENNMVKSATQVISTSYFTSIQVKQMLQLFSFENNKLDLAKLAFDKTIDQRNYSVVNDVFSSNSSKDELARFVRNH